MVLNKNLKKILDWSSRDLNDLISAIIATKDDKVYSSSN